MTSPRDVDSIFCKAVEIEQEADRAAYVNRACGGDMQLRDRVEKLLRAHARAGAFMAESSEPGNTLEKPSDLDGLGTSVGPYKLLQELGEGGMGVVYLAEQTHPVRRRVAVKIIKQGLDTRQFVARFEAERQALALMDHPNIAHVLDAGCTDSGRPYFVMELVKGIPITRFCDENQLTARERLGLFVSVCHAVQHAHQKGIIHRDLKPSNILVALYDDHPVPKIIDFGVAKATNQQLTDKTLFTQVGQIVGTWEYMSPEQAVLNQLDVDTRTDIYSLGVVLYELLTGVTPLESGTLRKAALEETLRLIREEEPPKPSTRVSRLGQSATATAAQRRTTAPSLAKTLRGDLDWIVMKALDKKRSRRYDAAHGLAADVARFLNGEPIEARPPSRVYQLHKFGQRHRGLVAAVCAVAVALIVGIISTTSTMLKLREVVLSLQSELTDQAFDAAVRGEYRTAEDAIEKARWAKAPPDLLQTLRGLALFYAGDPNAAIDELNKAVATDPTNRSAQYVLYWAYDYAGKYDEATMTGHRIAQLGLHPQSDYERLFRAQAELTSQSKPALISDVTQLIEQHRSWAIAYVVRSRLWSDLAVETMRMEDIEHAVADADIAQRLIPDNPFILTVALTALNRGIELKESLHQDASAWRSETERLAAKFGDWPKYVLGREECCTVYRREGRLDLERQEELALIKQEAGGLSTRLAWLIEQNRRAELETAQQSLARDTGECTQVMLAISLACSGDAGRSAAMRCFETLHAREMSYAHASIALDIPLLCGHVDAARQASSALLERELPVTLWIWWQHRARYLADHETEDEFLARAGPFNDLGCVAHYTIGLRALAEGRRAKAEGHFREVMQSSNVTWWCYRWAAAFLSCMERDPAWPSWIPPADGE